MQNVELIVTYTLKHGMRQRFLDEEYAEGIPQKVLEEDGCLRYEYCLSVDDEERLLLIEKWQSEQQQKKHLAQAHMQALKMIKERYVLDTKVEMFT